MRTAPLALALTAALAVGFASNAQADDVRCAMVPAQQWISIERVISKAESLGYSVREAKHSKGCWKIEGYDHNGAKVKIYLNPATADVVKPDGWRPPTGG